jgi:hypothetical protein
MFFFVPLVRNESGFRKNASGSERKVRYPIFLTVSVIAPVVLCVLWYPIRYSTIFGTRPPSTSSLILRQRASITPQVTAYQNSPSENRSALQIRVTCITAVRRSIVAMSTTDGYGSRHDIQSNGWTIPSRTRYGLISATWSSLSRPRPDAR